MLQKKLNVKLDGQRKLSLKQDTKVLNEMINAVAVLDLSTRNVAYLK
jgi:hypothetical protein